MLNKTLQSPNLLTASLANMGESSLLRDQDTRQEGGEWWRQLTPSYGLSVLMHKGGEYNSEE